MASESASAIFAVIFLAAILTSEYQVRFIYIYAEHIFSLLHIKTPNANKQKTTFQTVLNPLQILTWPQHGVQSSPP